MAVTKVVDVVSRAQTIVQDATGTRWPALELQKWLNDAYKEIILMRPDANTLTGTFTCAVGTRQVLTVGFTSALRLIDVVRNMAATSAKKAVRRIDRRVLDDQRPAWHGETGVVDIQHYMFDDRVPKEFLVYPPATALAQLEVAYSAVPAAHTLTEAELTTAPSAEVIKLDDIYSNAILDYVLYRSYSKDAEYAANAQRAQGHYAAMSASLGAKTQADSALSPNAANPGVDSNAASSRN